MDSLLHTDEEEEASKSKLSRQAVWFFVHTLLALGALGCAPCLPVMP